MASPSFRAKANAGGATAANVTCAVPTGTQDNDILLFFLSKDATGAVTDVAGTWNVLTNETSDTFHMYVAWKRASSEPANYTFNFASTWRDCVMLAYSGAITSETPTDPDVPAAATHAANVNSLATANNITTTADTTAVAFHNSENLTGWSAEPGGWTARQNAAGNEVHVMDQAVAAASTVTGPTQAYSGPSGPMKGYLLALQSVAAGGGAPAAVLLLTRTLRGAGV